MNAITDEVRSLLERVANNTDAAPYIGDLQTQLRTLLAAQPEPQGVELEVVVTIQLPDPCDEREGVWISTTDRRKLAALPAGSQLVRLTDAQHLLSTERAEAERKMAEMREERDSFQRIGIKAAEARDQLRARVDELEARRVVMPERMTCDDGYPSDDWLIATTHNHALDEVARLNPPQANSQEGEKS